eukprot:365239-Chlamydomonas_euryale.AAC.6
MSVSSASPHAVVAAFQLPKCACTSPSSCMARIMAPFSLRFFRKSITCQASGWSGGLLRPATARLTRQTQQRSCIIEDGDEFCDSTVEIDVRMRILKDTVAKQEHSVFDSCPPTSSLASEYYHVGLCIADRSPISLCGIYICQKVGIADSSDDSVVLLGMFGAIASKFELFKTAAKTKAMVVG